MEPTPDQLKIIERVINRVAPRYKFGFHQVEDIKQEAYLICLEALDRYDQSRPLENFIARHVSNRLKTLRRNKYYRQNVQEREKSKHHKLNETKRNLVDLRSLGDEPLNIGYIEDFGEKLSSVEAIDLLMEKLSPSMRNDFLRLANGVNIKFYRKNALFNKVKEILGEDW